MQPLGRRQPDHRPRLVVLVAPALKPADSTGSARRHSARPTGVRAGSEPKAKNGSPGSCTGYTCGISVARRSPARSAASAGAWVRMSLTTTSNRSSSISGSSASAASAADGSSSEPGGGGGNVLYSCAAVNASPSPSTASRQCSQVSTRTSLPRAASARASAIAGIRVPGVAERGDQEPPPAHRARRAPRAARARSVSAPPGGFDQPRSPRRTILPMRRTSRDPARRLRAAVDRLPRHTKEAMLRGIDSNRIIVGAYVDSDSGGICPMLAAHRNGGRTDVAEFARAWDEYRIVVAILVNEQKTPMFTTQERLAMVSEAFAGDPSVCVEKFDGLLVDFAARHRASAIVRGPAGGVGLRVRIPDGPDESTAGCAGRDGVHDAGGRGTVTSAPAW